MNSYLSQLRKPKTDRIGLEFTDTDRKIGAVISGTSAFGLGFYLLTGFNPLLFLLPGGTIQWQMHKNLKKIEKISKELRVLRSGRRQFTDEQWAQELRRFSLQDQQFSDQQFSDQQFSDQDFAPVNWQEVGPKMVAKIQEDMKVDPQKALRLLRSLNDIGGPLTQQPSFKRLLKKYRIKK